MFMQMKPSVFLQCVQERKPKRPYDEATASPVHMRYQIFEHLTECQFQPLQVK